MVGREQHDTQAIGTRAAHDGDSIPGDVTVGDKTGVDTGNVQVRLSSNTAAQLLETILMSPYASPDQSHTGLTVIDDGLAAWAPATAPVDDEDTAKGVHTYLNHGVRLMNCTTIGRASIDGARPQGHAVRGGYNRGANAAPQHP